MTPGIILDSAERRAVAAEMNLSVLKRLDASVSSVLFSASHVVLYQLKENISEWDRCDVEGALFIVQLDTNHSSNLQKIQFRLVVINRKSPDNYVEDIIIRNEELDCSDKMVMYSNMKGNTIGIWFYEEDEADRAYSLFKNIANGLPVTPMLPLTSHTVTASSALVPARTDASNTSGKSNITQSRPKRLPKRSTKSSVQTTALDRRDVQASPNRRTRRDTRREQRSSISSVIPKPIAPVALGSHSSKSDTNGTKHASSLDLSLPSERKLIPVEPKSKISTTTPVKVKDSVGERNTAKLSDLQTKKAQIGGRKVDESLARLFPDLSLADGVESSILEKAPESAIFESDAVSAMTKVSNTDLPSDDLTSGISMGRDRTYVPGVPMDPAIDQAIIAVGRPVSQGEDRKVDGPASLPTYTKLSSGKSKTNSESNEHRAINKKNEESTEAIKTSVKPFGTKEKGRPDDPATPKVKMDPELVGAKRDTDQMGNRPSILKTENKGADVLASYSSPRNNEQMNVEEDSGGNASSNFKLESSSGTNYQSATDCNEAADGQLSEPDVPPAPTNHGGADISLGQGISVGTDPRATNEIENGPSLPTMGAVGIPHAVHPMSGGGSFGGIHPQMALLLHQQRHHMMMMQHVMQHQNQIHHMHGVPTSTTPSGNIGVPAAHPIAQAQNLIPGLGISPGSMHSTGLPLHQLGMHPPGVFYPHAVNTSHPVSTSPSSRMGEGEDGRVSDERRVARSVALAHQNGLIGMDPNVPLDPMAFRAMVQRLLTDRELFDRVHGYYLEVFNQK